MSYYTKYRPQTIASLDLTVARNSLLSILKSGKFSHAYLFTGPKGTGKTSSARILAKVLNCEKNKEHLGEPCNECDSCRRITNGSSLACLEMDAASNRGIDDIRTLKERIGLAPAEGKYTVYIIDEVHMLTTEAFNALLKTLEEPPEHAVFCLCTTDPQKIPETVISRCTRVLFQKASVEEMVHSLQKAVDGEKLQIDPGVLELIAQRVDGSFRDGMKTLEQAVLSGNKLTVETIDSLMGYGNEYQVGELINALRQRQAKAAYQLLQQKTQQGADCGILLKRIIESLRTTLVEKMQSNQPVDADIIALLTMASEAVSQVKQSIIPTLPLELFIARWCTVSTPPRPSLPLPKVAPPTPVVNVEPVAVVVEVQKPPEGAFGGSVDDVVARWPEILTAVKPLNHSLEALLRSARPIELTDGWLTIEAYYKFHKEQLEQDKYKRQLEATIASVLGGVIYLRFALGEAKPMRAQKPSLSPEDAALAAAAEEAFGK